MPMLSNPRVRFWFTERGWPDDSPAGMGLPRMKHGSACAVINQEVRRLAGCPWQGPERGRAFRAGCARAGAPLGFTTWAYALARTTSGRMGATIYAVPTLVIIMSWLILGQIPQWLAVAGGALCLVGVAVSRSRSRADEKAPAQPAEATPILGTDGATGTLERNL
jgi:hypothetical protein